MTAPPPADRAGSVRARMYRRSDELGPPMNNRLALRIAVFGGVALALFVVLFFRLWFLQVLNGDKYLAEANNNRTREFRVSAPRGKILDRNGKSWSPTAPASRSRSTRASCPKTPRRAPRRADAARRADPQLAAAPAQDDARTAEAGRERAGDPAPRRRRLPRLLPAGEPGPLPRGRRCSASSCAATRTGRSPPTSSATSARSPKNS